MTLPLTRHASGRAAPLPEPAPEAPPAQPEPKAAEPPRAFIPADDSDAPDVATVLTGEPAAEDIAAAARPRPALAPVPGFRGADHDPRTGRGVRAASRRRRVDGVRPGLAVEHAPRRHASYLQRLRAGVRDCAAGLTIAGVVRAPAFQCRCCALLRHARPRGLGSQGPGLSLLIGTLGNVPETIRNDTVSVVHHPLARRVHQVRESAYRAFRTFRQGGQK